MLRWQLIEHDDIGELDRIPVPGGWIVRHTHTGRDDTLSITFVPDPDHTWLLKEGCKEGQKWADYNDAYGKERSALRTALKDLLDAFATSNMVKLTGAIVDSRKALYRPPYDTSQEQSDAH